MENFLIAGFLAKAPQKLVDEEKAKKEKFEEMMKSVEERLASIRQNFHKM